MVVAVVAVVDFHQATDQVLVVLAVLAALVVVSLPYQVRRWGLAQVAVLGVAAVRRRPAPLLPET